MQSRLERFSTCTEAKIAIAHCRRYVQRLKEKVRKTRSKAPVNRLTRGRGKNTVRKHQVSPISVEELQNSETVIVKWIQNDAFSKEIDVFQEIQANANCKDRKFAKINKAMMKKSSGICRFDPFLHPNGTLSWWKH